MKEGAAKRKKHAQETAEVYGFVLWISIPVLVLSFIAWAFVPDEMLEDLGLTYKPSKYWAVALPAYLVMIITFYFLIYAFYNIASTQPLTSLSTITDGFAEEMRVSSYAALSEREKNYRVPDIHDIPLTVVNEIMFGDSS